MINTFIRKYYFYESGICNEKGVYFFVTFYKIALHTKRNVTYVNNTTHMTNIRIIEKESEWTMITTLTKINNSNFYCITQN